MITGNVREGYELECEICGKVVDQFDEFQDAVEYKKQNGWKSVNINDSWEDRCEDCK